MSPVDLVLADPPYNSGLCYGDGTNDKREDYWEWLDARISLMNGERLLIKHSALKVSDFMSHWPSRMLIWIKPFSSGFPLNGVATHWEPIHWLRGKAVKWSKDYFECSAGNANKESSTGHPAQMPEAVQRWLLDTFTIEGDTILDPFMGSGTTLRAAKDLNRKAIGIEIEEKYCEIAANRLQQEVLRLGA
jgi:DNA modification methylase